MFALRQFTNRILPRRASALSRRWQSDTPNQLTQPSPSDLEGKPKVQSSLWATSESNGLIEHLSSRIKAAGPITVADFMREALSNPKYGYYGRHEQFGRRDDAITSPEIKQMYAELLAAWLVQEHSTIGGTRIQVVEMGPGRGLMIKQIIEVLHKQKYTDTHTYFALYEPNRLMRRRQAETLLGRSFDPVIANDYRIAGGNYSLIWIDELKQLLHSETYFIALQFFNNYPIHKFQKTPQGWKEVMIDWNPISKRLQYVLALKPTTMARLYANFLANVKDREHVEIGLQRAIAMQSICKHLGTYGGSLLVGDYAHWGEREDTFRAFRQDELVDPLSDPGNVDILCDVDFEELSTRGMQIPHVQFFGPVAQGTFLYNLGLNDRLEKLTRDKSPEEKEAIFDDVEKLVSPEYFGERFLYLCAQRTNKVNAPAGFSSPH